MLRTHSARFGWGGVLVSITILLGVARPASAQLANAARVGDLGAFIRGTLRVENGVLRIGELTLVPNGDSGWPLAEMSMFVGQEAGAIGWPANEDANVFLYSQWGPSAAGGAISGRVSGTSTINTANGEVQVSGAMQRVLGSFQPQSGGSYPSLGVGLAVGGNVTGTGGAYSIATGNNTVVAMLSAPNRYGTGAAPVQVGNYYVWNAQVPAGTEQTLAYTTDAGVAQSLSGNRAVLVGYLREMSEVPPDVASAVDGDFQGRAIEVIAAPAPSTVSSSGTYTPNTEWVAGGLILLGSGYAIGTDCNTDPDSDL